MAFTPERRNCPTRPASLGFFMRRMLPAAIAKLRELKPARGRLFVLCRRVIPLLALTARQRHNFAHFSILNPFRYSGQMVCLSALAHPHQVRTPSATGTDVPLFTENAKPKPRILGFYNFHEKHCIRVTAGWRLPVVRLGLPPVLNTEATLFWRFMTPVIRVYRAGRRRTQSVIFRLVHPLCLPQASRQRPPRECQTKTHDPRCSRLRDSAPGAFQQQALQNRLWITLLQQRLEQHTEGLRTLHPLPRSQLTCKLASCEALLGPVAYPSLLFFFSVKVAKLESGAS